MKCLFGVALALSPAACSVVEPSPSAETPVKAWRLVVGVVDGAHLPLPQATVQVSPLSPPTPSRTSGQPRGDGLFDFTGLDQPAYVVTATAPGYETATRTPVRSGDSPLEIVLRGPVGTIEGSVVDPAGQPVAGAQVQTVPASDLRHPFAARPPTLTDKTVTTDAQGRFRLDGLARGFYGLRVQVEGHAPSHLRCQVGPGGVTRVGVVHLERGIQVSGEVRVDGRPAGQVKVTIAAEPAEEWGKHRHAAEATTDDRGRFAFAARVPQGTYRVMAARTMLPNPLMQIIDYQRSKTAIALAPGQEKAFVRLTIETPR